MIKEEVKVSEAAPQETYSQFKDKIDLATIRNEEWVETSPEIIQYFNPHGLNGSNYFVYKGIKVCEFGKSEEIQDKMDQDLAHSHGKYIGVVDGRE